MKRSSRNRWLLVAAVEIVAWLSVIPVAALADSFYPDDALSFGVAVAASLMVLVASSLVIRRVTVTGRWWIAAALASPITPLLAFFIWANLYLLIGGTSVPRG